MKYFAKYFWNISKISGWTMGAGCIVHCNKVSKPVKGKYLLLCMNSIMYFLLTSYTLIMLLKVLSHFIMKITNFMKYFKEGVLKYFKISTKFLNISKWNNSSCISNCANYNETMTDSDFADDTFCSTTQQATCRTYWRTCSCTLEVCQGKHQHGEN